MSELLTLFFIPLRAPRPLENLHRQALSQQQGQTLWTHSTPYLSRVLRYWLIQAPSSALDKSPAPVHSSTSLLKPVTRHCFTHQNQRCERCSLTTHPACCCSPAFDNRTHANSCLLLPALTPFPQTDQLNRKANMTL